jgi:mRNA-degrading endonuclease RelE of RelBE toxin-antitoxin system
MQRVPLKDRARIARAVERLAETNQGNVKKLEGTGDDYRLRVGKWRARFTYAKAARELWVLEVFDRKEGY